MAFEMRRRVGFGQCDPAGIAYFPSYFDMLVGVTEEVFASLGHPWHGLMGERRIGMPTVKLDVDFTRPSFHGDELTFAVRLAALGRSSLTFAHEVSARGATVWRAKQVLVATHLDTHTSQPWPDDLRAALLPHLEA